MPNIIQIIKKAAIEAVEASKPTKILYGTVVLLSPFSIKIDQKFTVTEEFLVISKRMQREGFLVGDKIILIQEQGGQRYIVLDKVGG